MNVSLDLGGVISRAWQIIWKHKVLWIFGILAGCGSVGSNGASNSGYKLSDQGNTGNYSGQITDFFNNLDDTRLAISLAVIGLVVLVLIVLTILLGTIGRVGLIKGTLEAELGAERLSFSELFKTSLVYFWRVFGLNLLIGLSLAAIITVLTITAVIMTVATMGLMALCLIPLFCLLVPVMWAIGLLVQQINIIMVIEDLGISAAIQRGWAYFRTHLVNVLVMGLILGMMGMIAGGVIGMPLVFIITPIVTGLMLGTDNSAMDGLLFAGICLVGYLPLLLLLSGILRAFTESAWTLTYLRLTRPQAPLAAPLPVYTTPGSF